MGAGLRICSLLPSATEIVFALGLGERLVAVTHECDYPSEATHLPVITHSILMRAKNQTVRYIKSVHNLDMKTIRLRSDHSGARSPGT